MHRINVKTYKLLALFYFDMKGVQKATKGIIMIALNIMIVLKCDKVVTRLLCYHTSLSDNHFLQHPQSLLCLRFLPPLTAVLCCVSALPAPPHSLHHPESAVQHAQVPAYYTVMCISLLEYLFFVD